MQTTDQLTKLYIEVTTTCNLDCVMCMRRAWHEPLGRMEPDTFFALLDQLKDFSTLPTLHLGGIGEPMHHPHFLEFLEAAKKLGARVEMTSNGTLLDKDMATALVELGLDRLMVSFDGVEQESYEDIRVRSSFDNVVENLRELIRIKWKKGNRLGNPQVGIAFVAMKRNIDDLSRLPWLATRVGAREVQVSNLQPHTPELEEEILYADALTSCAFRASPQVVNMSLPKMDIDDHTRLPLGKAFHSTASISLLDASLSARNDYCRFAQEGFAAVRQDGEVSPCLELLHTHPVYLRGRRKDVTHHSVGNINETPLRELWEKPSFAHFRARLRNFSFSPCSTCGGCERFAGNEIDCTDNTFPTCGGCLWAQGFIQCP